MDVVVVGSCNTDLLSTVPRLPVAGETLHGDTFSIGFGGKGANQCVMASRLGAKTAMIAKVGDDEFGRSTVQNFKDNFVNADCVFITKEASSGVASISVTKTGENSIVIVAGANLLLSEADILGAESLIASAKILICQLEICKSVTFSTLELAHKHRVMTILNPAPGISDLSCDICRNIDIICLNETESEILTGHCVNSVEDAGTIMSILLDRGCKVVIVTLGAQGAVFATRNQRVPIHVPTRTVDAIDTTGAGDAFIGSLAFYLSTQPNMQLREAIRRSNEIATRSVLASGTQKSYPWKSDLPCELFIS